MALSIIQPPMRHGARRTVMLRGGFFSAPDFTVVHFRLAGFRLFKITEITEMTGERHVRGCILTVDQSDAGITDATLEGLPSNCRHFGTDGIGPGFKLNLRVSIRVFQLRGDSIRISIRVSGPGLTRPWRRRIPSGAPAGSPGRGCGAKHRRRIQGSKRSIRRQGGRMSEFPRGGLGQNESILDTDDCSDFTPRVIWQRLYMGG
eukprot:477552-Prorocentrum_minimum.AAC.1